MYYEDELTHHGIKGQKWGIRRYQNPDGTLTEEGKKRYREIFSRENTRVTENVLRTGERISELIKEEEWKSLDPKIDGNDKKMFALNKKYSKKIKKYEEKGKNYIAELNYLHTASLSELLDDEKFIDRQVLGYGFINSRAGLMLATRDNQYNEALTKRRMKKLEKRWNPGSPRITSVSR